MICNIAIKVIFVLFHSIPLHALSLNAQVDYEEVKALAGDCPPSDTCFPTRGALDDNLFKNTCECKPSCNKYGTCCVDSPNNRMPLSNATEAWPNTSEESCHYLMGSYRTLIVKHKCKPSWQHNQEIKALCEAISYNPIYEDPLAVTPVTNPKTSTTYKNYFCVLCNDDDVDNLVFWNVEVTKYMPESKYEKVKGKFEDKSYKPPVTFNTTTKTWGTMEIIEQDPEVNSTSTKLVKEGNDQEIFEEVHMLFKYPPSLSESIISCSPDLVSDCHPDWNDETVKKKCHSYMGMIYGTMATANGTSNMRRFRNIHCAICNFAGGKTSMTCFFRGGCGCKVFSISWLLDVNFPMNYGAVDVKRCMTGEKYDPFFQNCRNMKCIKPGYTIRNGTCGPS